MIEVPQPNLKTLSLVDPFFDEIEGLDASLRKLLMCEPIRFSDCSKRLPLSVVYLFSFNDRPIYVGRSNKFRQRLGNHCRPSSRSNQASLAFRLACTKLDHRPERYRKGQGADYSLRTVAGLADEFERQKQQLSTMDIRFVEEERQERQALLEIYCALALGVPHDFGTH